jgi:chemotaxis protein CheD
MSMQLETMVRMGELAVTRAPEDVLVSIGLGSCIGLALIDRQRALAGLAHIMLPGNGNGASANAGDAKFADVAVTRLVAELTALGAQLSQLEAVLVGGAQMFGGGGGSALDIGSRNEQATRDALGLISVPVRAAATAGNKGRTMRVRIDPVGVHVKEAGGLEVSLFS